MSDWKIIQPVAATNLVLNPSAEIASTTNYLAAAGGGTVTRDTTYARLGNYCYKVVSAGTGDGIRLLISGATNAIHYLSLYCYGTLPTATVYNTSVGVNFPTFSASNIISYTAGWVRYAAQVAAADMNGATYIEIYNNTANTWYMDCLQLELGTVSTTYLDGSMAGCYWNGLYHASTSARPVTVRSGGYIKDLYDDYGLKVEEGTTGYGMAPVQINTQSQALLPGSIHESTKTLPRVLELQSNYSGSTLTALHSKRKALIAGMQDEAKPNGQAFMIGYTGGTVDSTQPRYLWGAFRIASGLDGSARIANIEKPKLTLVAVDPFFVEDNQGQATLDTSDTLSSNRSAKRVNGQWSVNGSGFNGAVRVVKADPNTGRVYYGGAFTTANGVTVNRVCYWDGTTFVAMGATGVAGGDVYDIAIAPNHDVWVCGAFTTAAGVATNKIALWSYSAGTWTVFTPAGTITTIRTMDFDPDGDLWVGGDFTNFDGASGDYLIRRDTSAGTWVALGSGANGVVYAIKAASATKVYIGGDMTTINGVTVTRIGYWNGTTAVAMGSGASNEVMRMDLAPNGDLAVTIYNTAGADTINGVVCDVSIWKGSAFYPLTVHTAGAIWYPFGIQWKNNSQLYYFGLAGGSTVVIFWNGAAWTKTDLVAAATEGNLDILGESVYVGCDGWVDAPIVSGLTTVTTTGTTNSIPVVTIINSHATVSSIIYWLENQTVGAVLYLNYTLQAGETLTIYCDPKNLRVVSSWYGNIPNQPLSNSQWSKFTLMRGANTIASLVYSVGSTITALINWTPAHTSLDGMAA